MAAITIVAFNGVQNRANDTTVQSDLRSAYSKIRQFEAINSRWPTLQTEINDVFAVTRQANGGGNNTLLYCRSDTAVAIVARSVSTTGFYHSSVNGSGKIATWPGDGNANLCPVAGIPTGSAGYVPVWSRVNGAWETWFTPGA